MTDIHALARLITSPKTGIIKRLLLLPWSPQQIRLMHVVGGIPKFGRIPDGGDITRPGGSSLYLEDAYAKVVFEAIERYCASFVDYSQMILSAPHSDAFLFGPEFQLFADFQYKQKGWPFRRMTKESTIYWARGRSLLSGKTRFAPASLIFVPYHPTSPDEWLGPSTSTGMASGDSWERACLGGLLEVCEREAFTILWMNKLSMPRLVVDTRSNFGKEIDQFITSINAKISFINMTNDLCVPSVAAILDHQLLGKRLLTVGLSSKPTFEEACKKAMAECVSEYERLRVKLEKPDPPWEPTPDFTNVVDFEWHGLTYANPKYQKHLDFMISSNIQQPLIQDIEFRGGSRETLNHFLSIMENSVKEIVAINLTTREFEELGIHVVKIMIPDLVPLNADHNYPWLGHQRLYSVPKVLGYTSSETKPEDMNQMPHPFS